MGSCNYCNSFILFGGKRDGGAVYCNDRCLQAGRLIAFSSQLDQNMVRVRVNDVHQGSCPKCQGPGPVDVHKAHKVWSLLVLTSWSTNPAMSCKSCGVKRQLGASAFSLVAGWWGFPWGIVLTPTQIVRNIVEMVGGPDPQRPSPLLERAVRIHLAADAAQRRVPPPLPKL